MNDRFKFRYVDLDNKVFEVSSIDFKLGEIYIKSDDCMEQGSHYIFDNLLQCTGLKDKNGTLIYEGDIVKTQFYAEEYQANAKVVWNNDVLCFEVVAFNGVRGTLGICEETEVIGNIYENPELLKGQND